MGTLSHIRDVVELQRALAAERHAREEAEVARVMGARVVTIEEIEEALALRAMHAYQAAPPGSATQARALERLAHLSGRRVDRALRRPARRRPGDGTP